MFDSAKIVHKIEFAICAYYKNNLWYYRVSQKNITKNAKKICRLKIM